MIKLYINFITKTNSYSTGNLKKLGAICHLEFDYK